MAILLPLISIGYSPLGSVYVTIRRSGRAAVGTVLASISVGIWRWLPLLSLSGGSVLFAWAGFFHVALQGLVDPLNRNSVVFVVD